MPIVPAKCTSCGAVLKVNDEHDAAVCEFCKTPFIVEKAINIYQSGGATEDSLVDKGYAMMDINWNDAEQSFKKALDINPKNWKAWKGLFDIESGRIVFCDWHNSSKIFKNNMEGLFLEHHPDEILKLTFDSLETIVDKRSYQLRTEDGMFSNLIKGKSVLYSVSIDIVFPEKTSIKYTGKAAHEYLKRSIEHAPSNEKGKLEELEKRAVDDQKKDIDEIVKQFHNTTARVTNNIRMAKQQAKNKYDNTLAERKKKAEQRIAVGRCGRCGGKLKKVPAYLHYGKPTKQCKDCTLIVGDPKYGWKGLMPPDHILMGDFWRG